MADLSEALSLLREAAKQLLREELEGIKEDLKSVKLSLKDAQDKKIYFAEKEILYLILLEIKKTNDKLTEIICKVNV